MARRLAGLVAVALALCFAYVAATPQKRVLAVLQKAELQASHSKFFEALRSAGYTIDFKTHSEKGVKLKEYDTWHYDHLILFCPTAQGFGSLSQAGIVEFVDSGRNVLLAASADASEAMRALAAELGVDLEPKGFKVFDHFHHAAGQPDHSLLLSSAWVRSKYILGQAPKAPVLFRSGAAQSVPADSELLTIALSASETAYSHDPSKAMSEPPALLAGGSAALVTLVQARNNARVAVAGSLDMFSDELFDAAVQDAADGASWPKSGNKDFCVQVARWAFQDAGVLVAENLRHGTQGGPLNPRLYRVNDDVFFAVDLFVEEAGKRTPLAETDVQVEFVMLDPYVRLALQPAGNGTYSVTYKVPDVYGVFKYVLDYKHTGLSYVQQTQQVPVRPFRHDEYPRFLAVAYPYYASAVSTMVAFFVLGFFFLYHK